MAPAYLPLKTHCEVPKESHVGKFPANFCVKMIGTSSKYTVGTPNADFDKNMLLLKNPQYLPNHYETLTQ